MMLSKEDLWQVGTFLPVPGSSTYSIPYLQRRSPQYASASSGYSDTIVSYTPEALSNSQALRSLFARENRLNFFSLSNCGTVCTEPQYPHLQTVIPSLISRLPPHILHLKTGISSHTFRLTYQKTLLTQLANAIANNA